MEYIRQVIFNVRLARGLDNPTMRDNFMQELVRLYWSMPNDQLHEALKQEAWEVING